MPAMLILKYNILIFPKLNNLHIKLIYISYNHKQAFFYVLNISVFHKILIFNDYWLPYVLQYLNIIYDDDYYVLFYPIMYNKLRCSLKRTLKWIYHLKLFN